MSRKPNSHWHRWQMAAQVKAHRKAQLKFEAKPEEVKKRENRNQAERVLEREGKSKKGDNKDILHKDGNALDNDPRNWLVGNRHKNRSYKRDKGAHKVDPRS